ncbi:hypothetical protein KUCAC02_005557, partial [Chaenocephalus aceratus]
ASDWKWNCEVNIDEACSGTMIPTAELFISVSALRRRRDSSYRVQSGDCAAAQTSSGRAAALITSPALISPVLRAADGHDPMPCFASLNQNLLHPGDPRAELEHAVITTLTKRLL